MLQADCASCVALCCVAPTFAKGADFAIDKPAGRPCPNLAGSRCSIHESLRSRGFPGCTGYDCFGAGQRTTQVVFEGRPELTERTFRVFSALRSLHELLWYLGKAVELAPSMRDELDAAIGVVEALAAQDADALAGLDVGPCREDAGRLLTRVSSLVRGDGGRDSRGADLIGRRMRGADLRRASLRGALLVGADLSGADLTLADVLGADFRGTRLNGADLRTCLFLTQAQLDAAIGDAKTALPAKQVRPTHWE